MEFVGICPSLVFNVTQLKRICLLDFLKTQNLILKCSVSGNVFERAFWHQVVNRSLVVSCLKLFFSLVWNFLPVAQISFQLFCVTMWDAAFSKNIGGINFLVCIRVDWWPCCVSFFLTILGSCLFLKKKEEENSCSL